MSARKGARNERRSMRLLEASGYETFRSAGSHGPFDVIGVSKTGVVLCQVKTRDWPSLCELETLKDFPVPSNARKLIHRWRDRQSRPDVKEL